MDRKTDERNEVRQDALTARAFDFGLLQCSVGLPELRFIPEVRRLFDGGGQILNILKLQPLFVRLAVENLQCGDFVLCCVMNCSNDCTMVLARAKASTLKPSSMTWSWAPEAASRCQSSYSYRPLARTAGAHGAPDYEGRAATSLRTLA